MANRRNAIWLATTLCLLLALTQSTAAASMENVQIVVKGGSVDKMEPSQLWSGTQYDVSVTVLGKDGAPMSGSSVEFRAAGGAVSIDGTSSATTGSDGTATLSLTFTSGGIVRLYVDGSRVATMNIFYPSAPGSAMGVIGLIFIVLIAVTGYTLYVGPLKWLKEK